ncbi:MAG TPA: hypothetical protein VGV86_11370 [Acidimicrobiales bacterium]|nr:hypothetical protein [Acidimicrobiales bacterium]
MTNGTVRGSSCGTPVVVPPAGPRSSFLLPTGALAVGPGQGWAERRYLEAMEVNKLRRGRKRIPEWIAKRLAAIDARLACADVLSRLHLAYEHMDLEAELARRVREAPCRGVGGPFIEAAGPYSRRKGISYDVWRRRVCSKSAAIGRGALGTSSTLAGPPPTGRATAAGGRGAW